MAQSYPTSYIDFINRANDYAKQRAATTPLYAQKPSAQPSPATSSVKKPTKPITQNETKKDGFWDPVASVIGDITNKLVASGRAVENSVNESEKFAADYWLKQKASGAEIGPSQIAMARGSQTNDPWGQLGAQASGLVNGFFAGWNGDYTSPNYMSGEELIRQNRARQNSLKQAGFGLPGAPDNNIESAPKQELVTPIPFLPDFQVNYSSDFWPGLLLDIGTDPVTWISEGTSGLGMAALRGATAGVRGASSVARDAGLTGAQLAAARAAGSLSGAAKGTIYGAGKSAVADAYKVGRFSKTIKPVGLKQWYEVKKFNTFDKIARRTGLTTADLIAVTSGKIAAKDVADSFAKKASAIVEAGGKATGKNLTEEAIQNAAKLAKPYLPIATKFYEGALASKTGSRLAAGATASSLIPQGGKGEMIYGPRKSNTVAGEQLAEKTAAAEEALAIATEMGDEQAAKIAQINLDSLLLNDAGVTRTPAIQDTSPISSHAVLNIHPSWGAKEQYGGAIETIQKALAEAGEATNPEEAYSSPLVQQMFAAFDEVFSVQDLPKPTDPVNPTQYETVSRAQELFGGTSSQATVERIDEVLKLNNANDIAGPQDQAQFFDVLLDAIPEAEEVVARLKWALAAGDEDTVAEAIFGTQRALPIYQDSAADGWWRAITALAEFPYEIPGYSGVARDLVKEYERLAKKLELKPGSTKLNKSNQSKKANGELGSVVDWTAMARMTDMDFGSPEAMVNRLYAEYRAGIQAIGAGGEDVLGARAGREVELTNARIIDRKTNFDPEDMPKNVDEVATNKMVQELSDADMGVPQGEFAGQYVDILGRIIRDPEPEMKTAIVKVANQVKKAIETGEIPAKAIKFSNREKQYFTANTMGYGPGSSLAHRTRAKQGVVPKDVAEFLVNPQIPQELADIYDHIVGFARVPLSYGSWREALRRISMTSMPMRRKAEDKLRLIEKAEKYGKGSRTDGYLEYLAGFNRIADDETTDGVQTQLSKDKSAGVDLFGEVFKDGDQNVGHKNASLAGNAKEAAQKAAENLAETNRLKGERLSKFEARAKLRAAEATVATMQIEDLAVTTRGRLGERAAIADPNVQGNDPIHLRTTTGSWVLKPSDLLKNYLKADDAAAAATFIEQNKLNGNGLRNALRAIGPMLEYSDRNMRVFEVRPLAPNRQAALKLVAALRGRMPEIKEALASIKNVRQVISRENPMLGGEVGVFALPSGKFVKQRRVGFGSLLTKEGKDTFGEILTKVIADSGIDYGIHADSAMSALLEIIHKAARNPKGWRAQGWASAILAKKYETGASRPALNVEIKQGVLEHHLRDVGLGLQEFNEKGSPGFYDKEMRDLAAFEAAERVKARKAREATVQPGQFGTAKDHGFEAPDLNAIKRWAGNLNFSGGSRQYDLNAIIKIAQALADATGDADRTQLSGLLAAMNGTNVIKTHSMGNAVADFLRSRAPQMDEILTAEKIRRLSEVEAVNNFTVWNGDQIQKLAKATKIEQVIVQNRGKINAEMSRIRNGEFSAQITRAANAAFAMGIKTVERRKDRVFAQESSRAVFETVRSGIVGSKLFKPRSVEEWNARMLGMRLARQAQNEAGIFDGTRLTEYGGRIHPTSAQDHDFAYIGFIDVVHAMTSARSVKNAGPGLHLALSEDAPRVIFDLLEIDGKTFPIEIAQEAAVLAMKMSTVRTMTEGQRAVWLNDAIIYALKKKPGYEKWAEAVDSEIMSEASRAVALLAGSLANKSVTQNLFARHQARAALAVASANAKTARITQPIMDKLTSVADNIFASSGEKAQALEESINALRSALLEAGYAKGSLEAIISMKALEKHQLKSFTPMEFNTSRHTVRLKAAMKEATPDAKTAAIASENANLAKNVKKISDEALVTQTAAKLQEAIDTGDIEALETAVEQSTNLVGDASENANVLAEHIKNGNSPMSKRSAEEKQAGLLLQVAEDKLSEIDKEILDLTYWNDPSLAPEGRVNELLAMQAQAKADVDQLRESYYGMKEGRVATPEPPVAAMPEQVSPPVDLPTQPAMTPDEAGQAIVDGGEPAPQAEIAKPLNEYATRGLLSQVHQGMSAQAYKGELISDFGSIRQGLDSMATIAQDGMNKLMRLVAIKNVDTNMLEIPRVYDKIAATLISSTSADARRAYAEGLKGTQRQFAEEFTRIVGHFYDDAFIARMGLSSGHMQDFFDISHFTRHPHMNFGNKKEMYGWEVADYLKRAMAATLASPVEKGGMNWHVLFSHFNYVTQKAMQAPELMANFTARFGHIADGYATIEDAIADGYVRVAGAGKKGTTGFTQFLDPKQVYPKDIIEELANIEIMYNKMIPSIPATEGGKAASKILKLYDTTTTAVKKSLTTWMPSNWGVNANGEFMVNIMARVYNPSVYGKSIKTLHAGGEIQKIGRVNTTNSVSEVTTKATLDLENMPEVGKGLKIRIGGMTKTMSWDGVHAFLLNNGILMTNNSMEDFIIRSSEELIPGAAQQGISLGNPLSRAFKKIFVGTDKALANGASTRDNLFRVAHAIDVMEKGNFRSVEEMTSHLQYVMNKYHPTMYGLSNFESKVLRRLVFFYSWKRGALRAVMETMMDYPIAITAPQYVSYAISGAMGGQPAGYGHPAPANPNLPEWARTNITGPTWSDEQGQTHTISLNAPSADILQTYFGGLRWDKRLSGTQNTLENAGRLLRDNTITTMNPFLNVGFAALTGSTVSESGTYEVSDFGQYVQDMVGAGKLSRATGISLINDNGILQQRTGSNNEDPERAAQNQYRGMLGIVSPYRYNRVSDYVDSAKRENTQSNNIYRRRLEEDPTLEWWKQ